jgi:hypothetical protein
MNSPILLILFNRPDLTEGLLDIVRGQNGRKIYISADGPRLNNTEDKQLCAEVQKMARDFADDYDGECRFQFQTANLGCALGVKTAIDWFFENEEEGMILEDDCHPSNDFFWVLDDMLERFRPNESIFMVSGTSFIPSGLSHSCDFFLSKYSQIWGWGTWRRVWKNYELLLDHEQQNELQHIIEQSCSDYPERFYWLAQLRRLYASPMPHTWDYQLQFMAWKNNQKSLISSQNLVLNKGFCKNVTHTIANNNSFLKSSYDKMLSRKIQCDLSYNSNIDKNIFWFCILNGCVNRFRQIVNDSDFFFQLGTDYSCEKNRNLEDIKILKTKIDWMEKSLSWKLTSPLRKILSYILKR